MQNKNRQKQSFDESIAAHTDFSAELPFEVRQRGLNLRAANTLVGAPLGKFTVPITQRLLIQWSRKYSYQVFRYGVNGVGKLLDLTTKKCSKGFSIESHHLNDLIIYTYIFYKKSQFDKYKTTINVDLFNIQHNSGFKSQKLLRWKPFKSILFYL